VRRRRVRRRRVRRRRPTFHQKIGLKFKEETSKTLRLEYSSVWW
jgi:hypothetical protein